MNALEEVNENLHDTFGGALETEESQTPITYLNAVEGKLVLKDGEKVSRYSAINGQLQKLYVYEDAAPGQDMSWRVRLILINGDQKFSVESGATTVFGRMLAGQISKVSVNDRVRLSVWQASEDAGPNHKKMTNVKVELWQDSAWHKVQYDRLVGADKVQLAELTLNALRNHPAYDDSPPKRKTKSATAEPTQLFLDTVKECGYPPFEGSEDDYLAWTRQTLKNPEWAWSDMNEATWSDLATRIKARHQQNAPLPKALAAAAARLAEYDPFADE